MFDLELNKPRKVTTYGKTARQQTYTYNNFMQEGSPEKRKNETKTHGSNVKARLDKSHDGPSLTGTKVQATETKWDISSSEGEPTHPADPIHARPAKPVASKTIKPEPSGTSQAQAEILSKSKRQEGDKTGDGDKIAAQRKRKLEFGARGIAQRPNKVETEKDIYEFTDEDMDMAPTSAPTPLLSRNRHKTPTKPTTSTSGPLLQTGTRITTPEPPALRTTPVTARKTDPDIYDFPEDDMNTHVNPTMLVGSPLTSKKRQKTPAREVKVKEKAKSRAATPDRIMTRPGHTGFRNQQVLPKVANAKMKHSTQPKTYSNNGVTKRKLAKGVSAPASLFNMIREPPSPPTDSSESATGPATPEMASEMDLDSDTTPATPPNHTSGSPIAHLGSVTPRQKQLWTQLLGDETADSPSDLPIGGLHLSSSIKSASRKVASFPRPTSDVPQSTQNRRPRLIDSLKATSTIPEADEMDLDEHSGLTGKMSQADAPRSQPSPPKARSEISFKKTSTKVTYGQGRSYLEEKDEAKNWEMLAEDGPSQSRAVFGSQSHNYADEDDDMANSSQLRPAHDLHAAGSRKRLHDALSMSIMDLEQQRQSVSNRRSALRDIASELLDKEAVSCFLESGLDRSFLKSVEKDVDPVFLFLEAAILFLLLASDPTSSVLDHIFHSQTFSNVLQLLEVNLSLEKVVRDRKSNMSKLAQTMMLEFRDTLIESDSWGGSRPRTLTPCVLGLQAIEMVVRKLREHGSSYTLLEEDAVRKILDIARTEVTQPDPDLTVLELALSALQVNTISSSTVRQSTWPEHLIEAFASFLPTVLSFQVKTAHQCVQLALKLAVELANNNPVACGIVGNQEVMGTVIRNANTLYKELLDGAKGEAYTIALELTLLSFGLALNLTELSDTARTAVLASNDLVDSSIRLFLRGKKRTADAENLEDTQTSIVNAYLAFTLGNLCRKSKLQQRMKEVLQQVAPNEGMDLLLDTMQEFIQLNQLTDKRAFEGDEGNEVFTGFTERLKGIVTAVRGSM